MSNNITKICHDPEHNLKDKEKCYDQYYTISFEIPDKTSADFITQK